MAAWQRDAEVILQLRQIEEARDHARAPWRLQFPDPRAAIPFITNAGPSHKALSNCHSAPRNQCMGGPRHKLASLVTAEVHAGNALPCVG